LILKNGNGNPVKLDGPSATMGWGGPKNQCRPIKLLKQDERGQAKNAGMNDSRICSACYYIKPNFNAKLCTKKSLNYTLIYRSINLIFSHHYFSFLDMSATKLCDADMSRNKEYFSNILAKVHIIAV